MKYVAKNNGIHHKTLRYDVDWEVFIAHVVVLLPAIISFICAMTFGWTVDPDPEHPDSSSGSWAMWSFIFFSILAVVVIPVAMWVDGDFPFRKRPNDYTDVLYLDPSNLDNAIYKEAYNDCLNEIKAGTFLQDVWSEQFRNLNSQILFFNSQLEAKKREALVALPRKDYSEWMRETNKMFLGE